MNKNFNIIMFVNAKGLDTSCVGNVHRLPMIRAFAAGLLGRANILIVTAPNRSLQLKSRCKVEKMGENLFLFTPRSLLPISFADCFPPAIGLYRVFLRRQLCRVFKKLGFSRNIPKVLWVTHPFHYHHLGLVDERLKVYECYDDFTVFGQRRPSRRIKKIEQNLADKVDLILATAQALRNRLIKINKETYYFPNATDFELFNSVFKGDVSLAEEMKAIPKPIIGFTGNILHHCIDFDLLSGIISSNPDWSFVFVGQVDGGDKKEYDRLASFANTFFLGWQEYHILPRYLKSFDVAIMPYQINKTMQSVNPNKLYQFMAAGIPVVSTPIPEVKRFEGVVAIAEGCINFGKAIQSFLEHVDVEQKDSMISIALENSWEKRVEMVLGLIEEKLTL